MASAIARLACGSFWIVIPALTILCLALWMRSRLRRPSQRILGILISWLAYHLNYCEDYLVIDYIGTDKLLCAVMDGCTMGTDSYFASTLVGKLLRKIAKAKGYKELYGVEPEQPNLEEYLKSILRDLFQEILLIDKKTDHGIFLAIGDGVIAVNGVIKEFDQDNKPDYLGFHLHEDFDTWYTKQTQKIHIDTIQDVSLATDGIVLFTKIAASKVDEVADPISYLLQDKENQDNDDMMAIKLKRLEHVYGLQPSDDLAVIRIIKKDTQI
jgi:hypothetical protein